MVLLQGPTGWRLLMSEVPLWSANLTVAELGVVNRFYAVLNIKGCSGERGRAAWLWKHCIITSHRTA